MELIDREMEVLLTGSDQWKTFKAGEPYEIPANSHFKFKVNAVTDYCCSFAK